MRFQLPFPQLMSLPNFSPNKRTAPPRHASFNSDLATSPQVWVFATRNAHPLMDVQLGGFTQGKKNCKPFRCVQSMRISFLELTNDYHTISQYVSGLILPRRIRVGLEIPEIGRSDLSCRFRPMSELLEHTCRKFHKPRCDIMPLKSCTS